MPEPENLMTCKDCGESASGPDKDSVVAAMARHQAQRHPSSRRSSPQSKGGKK